MPTSPPHQRRDAQERAADAFGQRIAARLNAGLDEVHPDISERLQFARKQALQKRAAVVAAAPIREVAREYALAGNRSGKNAAGEPRGMGIFIIALVLSLGAALVGIEHQTQTDIIHEKAEIDMELLVDELPPAAYMDLGFMQYLRGENQR